MPKREEVYLVEGFAFASESEAEQARKELEGLKYIKAKMNRDNPGMVLKVYNKIVREKMFTTAVGYAYLNDLQEFLKSIPLDGEEEILPIPVTHPSLQESLKEEKQKHRVQLQEVKRKAANQPKNDTEFRRKYKLSLLVNLILVLSVVGMFLLSATSSHPTILDYEEKIINRYAAWEQELTEREAVLRELENQ